MEGRARQTRSSGLSARRFSAQWLSPRRRFVRARENRRPRLTGVHMTMDQMWFTNVPVLWQHRDQWVCQVDRHTGHGAIPPRARSSARAGTAEHA
jgi:hypothetical protein